VSPNYPAPVAPVTSSCQLNKADLTITSQHLSRYYCRRQPVQRWFKILLPRSPALCRSSKPTLTKPPPRNTNRHLSTSFRILDRFNRRPSSPYWSSRSHLSALNSAAYIIPGSPHLKEGRKGDHPRSAYQLSHLGTRHYYLVYSHFTAALHL
jgi:hypothetical protein